MTRAEFTALAASVDECHRALTVQFQRIAQLQAEFDEMKRAWQKAVAARP